MPRRTRPPWLPAERVIDAVGAGRWWDAIAVDGPLGYATAARLKQITDGHTGPIICDPQGPEPRLYFLVPAGTADRWAEPDTTPLGQCCYVGVNGTLDADTVGLHWITPPRCSRPEPLVRPQQLRSALGTARGIS
ncbi:hypothetical protein CK936_34280 [Streptomyces albireticuli]|uniref:DNA primase/polymerase bifunctional N-terminal domain-containing protein n=1 Tax=Streptomyces albireticuli TaxID=1940 RepID=A0A2A2CZ78_9ACTN|nr:hypothetical protein CK936_34280 [Streptomyces albireticuli]